MDVDDFVEDLLQILEREVLQQIEGAVVDVVIGKVEFHHADGANLVARTTRFEYFSCGAGLSRLPAF
jgi:hypothetical protein